MIIDTSRCALCPAQPPALAFSELSDQQLMDVQVFSFGFKHGMPVEADIMIDVMAVKVAINGFGRIGRLAFRQMFGR